jgi:hypothetical protein
MPQQSHPIDDLVKHLSDQYKKGGDETTGLGNELSERVKMNRAAGVGGASASGPAAPAKGAPAKMAPAQGPYGTQGKEKILDTSYLDKPTAIKAYDKGGVVGGSNIVGGSNNNARKTPVYDKGGKVNVNDGKHQVAILKSGERVLTEKQNKKYEKGEKFDKENPAENAMEMKIYDKGGKVAGNPFDMITGGKTPKKEIKEMVHSKTHNGKHVITHRHHSPSHHPDETHMFNNLDEAKDHMDAHAGDQPAEGAAPMTAAPSPMAAGAPPAGGAMPQPGM